MNDFNQVGNDIATELVTMDNEIQTEIATLNSDIDTAETSNIGASSGKVVFVGGPSASSLTYTSGTMPINNHYVAPMAEYISISGSNMVVNKAGTYQISGHVMQHCGVVAYRYTRLYLNGSAVQNSYNYAAAGWKMTAIAFTKYLNVGDSLYVNGQISSSNSAYRWHGGSEHYTSITAIYLG